MKDSDPETEKRKPDFWKPRLGILAVGIICILLGVTYVVSKHAGGGNREQYFGYEAVIIGIVFIIFGVCCVFIGMKRNSTNQCPKPADSVKRIRTAVIVGSIVVVLCTCLNSGADFLAYNTYLASTEQMLIRLPYAVIGGGVIGLIYYTSTKK